MLIRMATKNDMGQLSELIKEHAKEDLMPDEANLTKEMLEKDGFDTKPPLFKCILACIRVDNKEQLIGYSVFVEVYSTCVGSTLIVDDLYVQQKYRENGIRIMMEYLSKYAKTTGRNRMDLNFIRSDPSLKFYDDIGAENVNDTEKWVNYRLSKNAILKLANIV